MDGQHSCSAVDSCGTHRPVHRRLTAVSRHGDNSQASRDITLTCGSSHFSSDLIYGVILYYEAYFWDFFLNGLNTGVVHFCNSLYMVLVTNSEGTLRVSRILSSSSLYRAGFVNEVVCGYLFTVDSLHTLEAEVS